MRIEFILGVAALLVRAAHAQPPPGPGGPGGGPPLSPVLIPGEILVSYLGLTPDQSLKLRAINEGLDRHRPRPPQQDGSMPSQAEMQKMHKAMEASAAAANKKLETLLTPPQKVKLKTLMKAMETLQQLHIPPFALHDIKLTNAQIDKLATGKDALTVAQKKQMETMRPPFGGPGGPGR